MMVWQAVQKMKSGILSDREAAVTELVKRRAVMPLIRALTDKYAPIRERAAKGLGNCGDKRAADALVNAMSDESSVVAGAAAIALGKLGDPRAIEPLLKRIEQDGNLIGVGDEIAALDKIRWHPNAQQRALIATVRRKYNEAAAEGAAAIKPLIRQVGAFLDRDREALLNALYFITDPAAVVPLIEILQSPLAPWSRDRREVAAILLGNFEDATSEAALIQALSDDKQAVRGAAAISLGKRRSPRAAQPLLEIVRDLDQWGLWPTAAKAIERIGDTKCLDEAITSVSDFLMGPFRKWETWLGGYSNRRSEHSYCLEVFAEVGSSRTIALLVELIRENDIGAVPVLTRVLEREAVNASIDDLRSSAELSDVHYMVIEHERGITEDGYDVEVQKTLDCSPLRKLARQELDRRSLA